MLATASERMPKTPRHHRADPDGDVDEEDPLPAERLREHAAEQEAERTASAGDGAPDAECAGAVTGPGEGRRDDRERCRRDQGGAQPLQGAGADELSRRRRQPAQQRCDGEERHAREEQALAAEEVSRPAAEQKEPAEEQRVRVDDPLQAAVRKAEIGLDRRQRDVRDGGVEHDHELREAHEDEDDPAVGRGAFGDDGRSGHAGLRMERGGKRTDESGFTPYQNRIRSSHISGLLPLSWRVSAHARTPSTAPWVPAQLLQRRCSRCGIRR